MRENFGWIWGNEFVKLQKFFTEKPILTVLCLLKVKTIQKNAMRILYCFETNYRKYRTAYFVLF